MAPAVLCRTAEEGLSWEFAKEGGEPLLTHHTTATDREANPWFGVFSDAIAARGVSLSPEVFPASTDARFVRALKIPALGFSPLRRSPILLHEHNEYVDEAVFLEGIDVYETLIPALANAPRFDNEANGSK
jgi:aminoacylase